MKKLLLVFIVFLLIFPLFFFSHTQSVAFTDPLPSRPFTPHELKVLVVSPENVYWSGGHYLTSDLARYGFNVTQQASDDGALVDYRYDEKTSNLDQYDAVILHGGYFGAAPTMVSVEEVNHFIDYSGILIVIGNALFGNESATPPTYWDSGGGLFSSAPIQRLEQRLGVDFTGFLGVGGAWHNNGIFNLLDNSINGLPSSLSYVTEDPISINSQVALTTAGARSIYDFTTTSPLNGRATSGVTYFKNATGAVGIYIQGSYIYAKESPGPKISYFGLTNIEKRSGLLASLIAYSLGSDINAIIRPQPLATIRLNDVGSPEYDEDYLEASLANFNTVIDTNGIVPSIAFTDYHDVVTYYWTDIAPKALTLLKTTYRDWEYSSNLQRKDLQALSQTQIEALIDSSRGNYSSLGMDLFSTVVAPAGLWSQATLDAMANKNLHLIELAQGPYAPVDWWNVEVNSSVIVHTGMQMAGVASLENFTQISMDSLNYEYFVNRDKWALAVVNGFPSFFFGVPNFRRNEVGTYSVQTIYSNLTSEISDIRFVPLIEAGLYFGNKWIHINNPIRNGSIIEFDLDNSEVPNVVDIGKGMTWLRIDTYETISDVFLDDRPWHYFDDHSIRLPANVVHVKVTLGPRSDPTVLRSFYKVTDTVWSFLRFKVTLVAARGLNITVELRIPEVGAFNGTEWNVFSTELSRNWGYSFDPLSRILSFWAISDGSATFEAGPDVVPPVFWKISHSPTWYNSSVTVSANITDLRTYVENAVLSYRVQSEWTNITMLFSGALYVGEIPALPYKTIVQYELYAFDIYGNARISNNLNYTVSDKTPPEIGIPEWGPSDPPTWQQVYVRVQVTEPESASGVHDVSLYYYFEHSLVGLKVINMTREGNYWWINIPGQSGGRIVSFFVLAYDNAGNYMKTEEYTYTVAGNDAPNLVLFGGLGAAISGGVVVGAILYFKKFRKKKELKKPE